MLRQPWAEGRNPVGIPRNREIAALALRATANQVGGMAAPSLHKQTVQVSKLDAARRQLDTAIRLFFREGDAVSIHTLTAAAHQLLHDLSNGMPGKSTIRNPDFVKPGKEKIYLKALASYENFFKHADTDPKDVLSFNPEATESFMADSVRCYYSMTQENVPTFRAFHVWFCLKHPELLNLPADAGDRLLEAQGEFAKLKKGQFFDVLMRLDTT